MLNSPFYTIHWTTTRCYDLVQRLVIVTPEVEMMDPMLLYHSRIFLLVRKVPISLKGEPPSNQFYMGFSIWILGSYNWKTAIDSHQRFIRLECFHAIPWNRFYFGFCIRNFGSNNRKIGSDSHQKKFYVFNIFIRFHSSLFQSNRFPWTGFISTFCIRNFDKKFISVEYTSRVIPIVRFWSLLEPIFVSEFLGLITGKLLSILIKDSYGWNVFMLFPGTGFISVFIFEILDRITGNSVPTSIKNLYGCNIFTRFLEKFIPK